MSRASRASKASKESKTPPSDNITNEDAKITSHILYVPIEGGGTIPIISHQFPESFYRTGPPIGPKPQWLVKEMEGGNN